MLRRPLTYAALAVAAAAIWLWFEVRWARGGNLTGLYYTGQLTATPPQLGREDIYRIPNDRGYDGQFYHYVAHDPWLSRGLQAYVDNPRLRWRRILVPGLAWLFAGGSDAYLDSLYVAVQLAFVFLGSWWLGQLAVRWGRDPAWGLAFLLVPAVLVSLDRMTIDLPLAALTVAFVLYSDGPAAPRYGVLALAPLVRETGLLLAAGFLAYSGSRREWRRAAGAFACMLPAAAWYVYVDSRTPSDHTPWLAAYPFSGLIERTVAGVYIPRATLWLQFAGAFERLALTGLWAALLLSVWLFWRHRRGVIEWTAAVWFVFAAALGKADIWADAYAAGRTLSPLLLLVALVAMRDRRRWYAAPMLAILPRIALQYETTVKEAFRAFR